MPKVSTKPYRRADLIRVSLANEQSTFPVNERQLIEAVQAVVRDSSYTSATISLAVVDDATICELNRRYLDHDYPTDVLSFVLEDDDSHLEGEVVISSDTAAREAQAYGWPAAAEQLLYVIHGTLHLVGYRDKSSEEIAEMRAAEQKYLQRLGFARLPASSIRSASTDRRAIGHGDFGR